MQANTEAVPERGWSSGEEWGPSHRRVGGAEQRGLGAREESECLGKAAQKLDPRAGPTGYQAVTRPWSRVRFSKDDRLEGNEGRHASVNRRAGGSDTGGPGWQELPFVRGLVWC